MSKRTQEIVSLALMLVFGAVAMFALPRDLQPLGVILSTLALLRLYRLTNTEEEE